MPGTKMAITENALPSVRTEYLPQFSTSQIHIAMGVIITAFEKSEKKSVTRKTRHKQRQDTVYDPVTPYRAAILLSAGNIPG